MTLKTGFPIALGLAIAVPAVAHADAWDIDSAHSAAQFTVRHLGVSNVRGQLGKVTGTVVFDDKSPSKSSVEATIDAAGIDTRDEKRDAHLKSPDFFDVAKYPTVTFKSKRVVPAGGSAHYKVTGDLTLHGVTREVVLDVNGPVPSAKDPWGNVKSGAEATTTIHRKDFGLTWNKALETGGLVVGDDVKVTIDVELLKKVAPTAAATPAVPTKK